MLDIRQRADDLDRLLAVTRALSGERDFDRLLDVILDAAKDLLNADRCSLFLVDRETGDLLSRVAHDSSTIRLPRGSGLAGSVAETGDVINITDAHNDDRFNSSHDDATGYRTKTILTMPLIGRANVVVGVLQVLNRADGQSFDDRDELLAAGLCSQAAIAIDTAQLVANDLAHQRLARDLELAQNIQQGLLPQSVPEFAGWSFAQWQKPCDETGGDYHDYRKRFGALDVVVGDVSGHGVGAALLMSTARATLRALQCGSDDPSYIITQLNRLLSVDMASDRFMTMTLCQLDGRGGCRYVAAGHEPPWVYRAASGRFEELESTGMILGALEDAEFDIAEVEPLAAGDLLVLCTDGLFESPNASGEMWGTERLCDIIKSHAHNGAQAVCDGIVAAIQAFTNGQDPEDDMTLVVAERLG